MEQANIDAAVKRLRVKNRKEIHLMKKSFAQLCHHVTTSIAGLAEFRPSRTDPAALRKVYNGLYAWLAEQLSDVYDFPIHADLLHEVKVKEVDLREGTVEVEVKCTYERVTRTFTLHCVDEGAPYSTEWSRLLTKASGTPETGRHFVNKLQVV